MDRDYAALHSICSGIFAGNFAAIDRLKAVLQVAFEFLRADSITAYRYDRVTQRLEITAMPGVLQREVMRGPTPEPIFQWEGEKLEAPRLPEPQWLEKGEDYHNHIDKLATRTPASGRKSSTSDFRTRQLTKYPQGTDLSMAKVCLYKGIGQTQDRVGMLFFNFKRPAASPTPTFDSDLRSAIVYVATLVREILIDELYHTQKHTIDPGTLMRDALNLLKMAEEHALGLAPTVDGAGFVALSEDYRAVASTWMDALRSRLEYIDNKTPYRKLVEKRLQILEGLAMGQPSSCSPADSMLEMPAIAAEAQLLQICAYVCRAALGTCETFGGQADIVFVLGGGIGRRIAPQDVGEAQGAEYFWLNSQSITSYCLDTGKVFALNNIREKAHPEFRQRFENEYAAQQYQSLIVVPIFNVGPYRCVLRLMSSDRNCFLDHHTQAVQFTAFVAKHSLKMLMQAFMRRQTSQGLAFFAQGQAVGPQASTEDLLREALKVLGADYAVFWCIPEKPKALPFEACVWVPAPSEVEALAFWLDDDASLVRPEGMTHGIYRYAETQKDVDALFCVHVLSGLCDKHKGKAFPDYSFEVYKRRSDHDTSDADIRTRHGSHSAASPCDFPGIGKPVELNPTTDRHPHTQVGLVVAQHGSPPVIRGVMWIGFDGLRDLNWWERAYLRGLSNYLAQGIAASGLVLALRSFNHGIEDLAAGGYPDEREGGPPRGPSDEDQETIKEAWTDLQKACAGWEMICAKAREVKRMLSWSQAQETGPWTISLKEPVTRKALRNAWAIATDLLIVPSMFKTTPLNGLVLDKCKDMTIAYCPDVDPDVDHVNGATYSVATVVLQNARTHGRAPYLAWVVSLSPEIRIIFGNGGGAPLPEEDVLRVPEAQMKFADPNHGVGLWFARRLLRTEGGTISLLRNPQWDRLDYIPDIARECRTFYEVILPKEV